jgi:hypothetical protein
MGNKNVHPYAECPICLESSNMMLKLNCSHSFDTYCIQKHLMTDYNNGNHPRCPYCRSNLYSEIRKIFKKWNIIDYRVDDISVKNEFDLATIYNKIKITKLHSINVNINVNKKGKIIVPLFNNTYIPIFFKQNIVKMIMHDIPFTTISNDYEMMDFSNGCMLECFFNGIHYKKFLKEILFKNKQVNKLFVNNFNESIIDMYNISDINISFYIKDKNNVICIDDNGITTEFNIIDNNCNNCNILYRTYFLIYEKKFHIINEIYRIYSIMN